MAGASARAADAVPRVLVSIKPTHSLAASVMEGVGTPELLLTGAASPHSYSLKPSDARKIARAQLIFWVGPVLENFLVTPIANLAPHARVVRLMDAPGLLRLPARGGGVWEADADERPGGVDGHIWGDPRNASAIARAMAAALAAADPAHAARYRANADALARRLTRLDAKLAMQLAPVKEQPYIVFHDAYHYFENRYGLAAAGAVTVAPDRPPGTRRVEELRAKIASAHTVCVFSTPEFPPRIVTALVAGTSARTGTLDDLGANLAPGPALYETWLANIANSLVRCLGR